MRKVFLVFLATVLKLLARPVVGTPFGNLAYPDEITIVDKSFN